MGERRSAAAIHRQIAELHLELAEVLEAEGGEPAPPAPASAPRPARPKRGRSGRIPLVLVPPDAPHDLVRGMAREDLRKKGFRMKDPK